MTEPTSAKAPATDEAKTEPRTASTRLAGAARAAVEWWSRGRSLREARAALAGVSPERRRALERARSLLELATRAHEPNEALGVGASPAVASELYKQASYWALYALLLEPPRAATPSELWSSSDAGLTAELAGGPERRALIEKLFSERSFVELGLAELPEQEHAARELGRFARESVAAAARLETRVQLLRAERVQRVVLSLAAVLLFAGVAVPRLARFLDDRQNLAAGQPWRASSEFLRCEPERERCGSVTGTRIFFHTQEEPSPWVEFDLGRSRRLSTVEIRNRSDCCEERAVPLVIEVSDDRARWKEVARRTTAFQTWTAKLGKQKARWVRARGLSRTMLHFESLRVYE